MKHQEASIAVAGHNATARRNSGFVTPDVAASYRPFSPIGSPARGFARPFPGSLVANVRGHRFELAPFESELRPAPLDRFAPEVLGGTCPVRKRDLPGDGRDRLLIVAPNDWQTPKKTPIGSNYCAGVVCESVVRRPESPWRSPRAEWSFECRTWSLFSVEGARRTGVAETRVQSPCHRWSCEFSTTPLIAAVLAIDGVKTNRMPITLISLNWILRRNLPRAQRAEPAGPSGRRSRWTFGGQARCGSPFVA